jgi:chromosomal replication initiation ATPase DnaA
VPAQLVLPFETRSAAGREDFLVGLGNSEAVALIDRWPDWPIATAVLHGPAGAGKSHLVQVWQARAGAVVVRAEALSPGLLAEFAADAPLAIEDVDQAAPGGARDHALFTLLNEPRRALLLTGREAPLAWHSELPDLASRFAALPAFALWAPDDTLLSGVARKLFTDRQLDVPDSVVMHMLRSLERSPAAIRDFVARADARALAQHRPVNLALIRELLAEPLS